MAISILKQGSAFPLQRVQELPKIVTQASCLRMLVLKIIDSHK